MTYISVKKLPALLREVTSNHHGYCYRSNYFHSVATLNKLESHKKECENKDSCNVVMPSEDTKIKH